MDRHIDYLKRNSESRPSIATTIAYGIALLYVLHQILVYLDFPILSPQDLLWNAVVYIIPQPILLDRARRHELKANDMLSQSHAAKSDALRRMLGIGGHALMDKLPAEGIMRRASGFARQPVSDAPAGLGNWDNSCYQNSVLQGLASLDSLKMYLRRSDDVQGSEETSTSASLLETISRLNDISNNGKQLWTPAKLKNMSSWQQQDAQEYFSKIMDELDKEAGKFLAASKVKPGLESIAENTEVPSQEEVALDGQNTEDPQEGTISADWRNPLDGLLAQRVACTRCGYSEGLSMIPFNCLTVPLGSSQFNYNIEECLDEYTKLEEISEVECAKCTLFRAEAQLVQMLPQPPSYHSCDKEPPVNSKVLELPPELRAQAFRRLRAIQQALAEENFEDKTLNEACQIPKKARVASTKTRQAVIGRAPQSLVVHVNRSVFDELTGAQKKNYANVRYPLMLDLKSWMLDDGGGGESIDPSTSMLSNQSSPISKEGSGSEQVMYRIKAVVTHYGRHENGHYICYRQHNVQPRHSSQDGSLEGTEPNEEPLLEPSPELRWWRLSDEDVSPVSEEDVLVQGGVFMLFYEREDVSEKPRRPEGLSMGVAETARSESAITKDPTEPEPERTTDALTSKSSNAALEVDPDEPVAVSSISESHTTESTSVLDQSSTAPSTEATTEDEFDGEAESTESLQPPQAIPKPSATPMMRTARSRQESRSEHGFAGNAFRAVAAT